MVRVEGARLLPFAIFFITYKIAVYARAKRADTLPYFISTPLYSVDQPQTGANGVHWTVHHVQNHTLLGHSPPTSQAGRRVGPFL
jgi:hypothetical protein